MANLKPFQALLLRGYTNAIIMITPIAAHVPGQHMLQSLGPWPDFKCAFSWPLSISGQEKGWFGVGLGVFCVCTYPKKGCVTAG